MLVQAQQYEEAIVEAKRAIAGDPNDAEGYIALGGALSFAGRPAEALQAVEQAMRLNPHYPSRYMYQLGLAQFAGSRLQDAVKSLERALAMAPDDYWSQRLLLATYGELGRGEQASKLLATMKSTDRRGWISNYDPLAVKAVAFWYPFANADDAKRFAAGLSKAGVPD
jgi:Flp pilus assembly protein TadD